MAQVEEIRQTVLMIARCLVDKPEEVSVERTEKSNGTLLRVFVAPGDIGQIIGRQGRIARGIRTLVCGAAMAGKHKINIDIVD